MVPVSFLKRAQQAKLKLARLSRWTSHRSKKHADADKENVAPANPLPVPAAKLASELASELAAAQAAEAQAKRKLDSANRKIGRLEKQLSSAETKVASTRRSENRWKRRALTAESTLLGTSGLDKQLSKMTSHRNRLRREKKALEQRLKRSGAIRDRTVRKAVADALKSKRTFRLKEKGGIIPENVRQLSRALHALARVPMRRVNQVIHLVLKAADVEVEGTIDRRSVKRAVGEGGIASMLQIAQAIKNGIRSGGAATISSDGTTHKKRNYNAQHMVVVESAGAAPQKFFTGIAASVDHSAKTQIQLWTDFFEALARLFNNTSLGSHAPLLVREIAVFIRGMNSDHAADVRLVSELFQQWRRDMGLEQLGDEWLKSLPSTELLAVICEELPKFIDSIGGAQVWQMLPASEQAAHYSRFYRQLAMRYGEDRLASLPESQRRFIDVFVWAGCCMHKDLNAVKGGCSRFADFWATVDIAPLKLYNKDNAAVVAMGDSEASARAEDVSTGGAIKLAQLAGAVFKNKNDKLGQQDMFKAFFVSKLHAAFSFPDTSNTRFQSFCAAAAALLLHLELFTEFLGEVRDSKTKGPSFTNMEANVYRGLKDPATLTELAVLALYAEAVCHPYIRRVRTPGTNAIDLGPLHLKLVAHCQAIIDNPDLLLGPGAAENPQHATLDGLDWQHPNVVERVRTLAVAGRFPHLRGALVAFFEGARDTFVRFSAEFVDGGVIDMLLEEERSVIFLPSTNDWAEGELASMRRAFHASGNVGLLLHNARTMLARNGTLEFIEELAEDVHKAIRKAYRVQESEGHDAKMRAAQAAHNAQQAALGAQKAQEKREAEAAKQRAIAATIARTNDTAEEIQQRPGTNAQLDEQLTWFRYKLKELASDHKIPANSTMKKDAKIQALVAAHAEYHRIMDTGPRAPASRSTDDVIIVEDFTEREINLEMEVL